MEVTDERVAVTGAGGFIGLALCRRLAGDGRAVVGLDVDGHACERVEAAGARFEPCVTDPDAGERGAFTAWDGHAVTTAEFFGHYARMLGRDGVPTAPAPLLGAAGAAAELVARLRRRPPPFGRAGVVFLSRRAIYPNTRAREALGWEPAVGLEEGMRRTAAWFRAVGMLGDG